jgi:hypothetical protein
MSTNPLSKGFMLHWRIIPPSPPMPKISKDGLNADFRTPSGSKGAVESRADSIRLASQAMRRCVGYYRRIPGGVPKGVRAGSRLQVPWNDQSHGG